MSTDGQHVTVALAGQMTGIPERTIRRWIRDGKLPAVAGQRGSLVALGDVQRMAALTGRDAATAGHTIIMSGQPANPVGRVSESLPATVTTEDQFAIIRDTLLRPLIEQNERQQETISGLSLEVGQLRERAEQQEKTIAALHEQLRETDAIADRQRELQAKIDESRAAVDAAARRSETLERRIDDTSTLVSLGFGVTTNDLERLRALRPEDVEQLHGPGKEARLRRISPTGAGAPKPADGSKANTAGPPRPWWRFWGW